MKKILQIAAYDFRRIALNPITMVIVGILMIGCLILGTFYKIPVSPSFQVITAGESAEQIYENFLSSNSEIDTKDSLDNLLRASQNKISVMSKESKEYNELTAIKAKFDKIYETEFSIPIEFREPSYIEKNNIDEIVEASNELENFILNYENLQEFDSKLVFTKENFKTLKDVSDFFAQVVSSKQTIRQKVEEIYKNKDIFSIFSPEKLSSTWWADEEKLGSLQTIINDATAKTTLIAKEMQLYANATNQSSNDAQKMISLITNYKSTCINANFVVQSELKILMTDHYGNLDNLFGYTKISSKEDIRQNITKAKFLLQDENMFFTQWQEPLNFNTAMQEQTSFDNAYFLLSIIGFLTILFGIFCAYKLFGRDRKNGKMDLILSQNVTFGQVFAGKFVAIVLCTTFVLSIFLILSVVWSVLFYPTIMTGILAVFNLSTAYTISPVLFLLIKFAGIELQVIFWAIGTIFLMNISRKFNLTFALALLLFATTVVTNIFLNGILVYCLFPFIHTDLTALLGGGSMNAGFLQTALYSNGNFFISLAYYLVVVILLYNFTKQLFKKN